MKVGHQAEEITSVWEGRKVEVREGGRSVKGTGREDNGTGRRRMMIKVMMENEGIEARLGENARSVYKGKRKDL